MSDPYKILGVEPGTPPEQLKAAYRKLAMQYHPDRNPGDKAAEERFKEIGDAYDRLTNPKRQNEQAQQPRYSQDGPFEFHFRAGPGGFSFEDIFSAMSEQRRRKNPDLHAQCVISLEQAQKGCEVMMEIRSRAGANPTREAVVSVPAGVENGMRLKLTGQGDRPYPDLPPGDLLVTVMVADHPMFHRVGPNLLVERTIDAFTAMLGGFLEVPLLGGGAVNVTVPAGVQPGQRLRVTGHGMPQVGSPQIRGDLIVALSVEIPTLNEAQRKLVEEARSAN